MAVWAKKKVMRLAKGMSRKGNCYTIAIKRVMKGLQYQYRDRRRKKRIVRREWILAINNACREHNIRYSRFICELNRSNIKLNRKMLANLAVNEPLSFKATLDHVMLNSTIAGAFIQNPQANISYEEALKKNLLSTKIPEKEPEMPELKLYGLRNPERDSGTDADYLRLSFRDEDEKWLEEKKRMELSLKEQKKYPREVIDDNWDENQELYASKAWKRT